MEKILVIISSFRWGGINRSLQSWLEKTDPREIEVDLFVMVHSGNYDGAFRNCHLLPKDFWVDAMIDHVALKSGVVKLLSAAMKVLNRLSGERFQHWIFKKAGNRLVRAKNYDAVVGWHEGVPTTFVSHIKHPNKISWIHCDYANYTTTDRERPLYEHIDKVVCVSKYARGSFVRIFPDMADKVRTIYNILDVEDIRAKAALPLEEEFDRSVFNIVSVGRVSEVKQFCRIPEIARKVMDSGCRIAWYIVGPTYPGAEYETLMENIRKYEVADVVHLTGGKDNPYPYIANADLLVCTSLSESWGYTINEAKVLGVPSVSTDWGAACESITDGVDGYIRPLEELGGAISSYILDRESYAAARRSLENFEYDNEKILLEIKNLLNAVS